MYYLVHLIGVDNAFLIDEDTLKYIKVADSELYNYEIHFSSHIKGSKAFFYRGGQRGMFLYDNEYGDSHFATPETVLLGGHLRVRTKPWSKKIVLQFGKVKHKLSMTENCILRFDNINICTGNINAVILKYAFKFKNYIVFRVAVVEDKSSARESVALLVNEEDGSLVDYSLKRSKDAEGVMEDCRVFKHTGLSAKLEFAPLEL